MAVQETSQSISVDLALTSLEMPMEDKKKNCFEYLYERKIECSDEMFKMWKNLKEAYKFGSSDLEIRIINVPGTVSGVVSISPQS